MRNGVTHTPFAPCASLRTPRISRRPALAKSRSKVISRRRLPCLARFHLYSSAEVRVAILDQLALL